jgi:hypothetical protein
MYNIFRFTTLKHTLLNFGYNLLYWFSLCQIKLNQLSRIASLYVKKTTTYLKDNNYISPDLKMKTIQYINNNTGAVDSCLVLPETRLLSVIKNGFECDNLHSIFITHKNEDTGRIHKLFLTSCPETIDYKLSNVEFIQVEIQYGTIKCNVVLKTVDYTFYLVNNTLNANFFRYYLRTIAGYEIDETNFNYIVTIIDGNADMFTMSPTQSIVFHEENTYTLYTPQ